MVEQMLSWLALDLHTPPEARKLGGGSNIMLLALSENQLTAWRRPQAHAPIVCIRSFRSVGKKLLEDLYESQRYIYTFLSIIISHPKRTKRTHLIIFSNIF